MIYTIERIKKPSDELYNFLSEECFKLSELFGSVFNPENAQVELMISKGIFLVGRKRGEIRGVHISWLFESPLDKQVKILQQQLFYVKPDSGRMAFHLFKKFIDIGETEANHIITMLTTHTNIKSDNLKKLGFNELEVMYRMEVSK